MGLSGIALKVRVKPQGPFNINVSGYSGKRDWKSKVDYWLSALLTIYLAIYIFI